MSRADPNYEMYLIGTLDAYTFLIQASVTVHTTAHFTFRDRQNVIPLVLYTARHAGKFVGHSNTPFRSGSHCLEK